MFSPGLGLQKDTGPSNRECSENINIILLYFAHVDD